MSKWIITILVSSLLFTSYFAYDCWQDENKAKAEVDRINAEFTQYKEDNKAVKQLEKNIIEVINNANNTTNELRNNVDNGLVELLVKVESIERDTTTASTAADQALRLARTTQQNYYNLTNAINYNKTRIDGWQKYYCMILAPKNGGESVCSEYNGNINYK